jgi:hypothetical protein
MTKSGVNSTQKSDKAKPTYTKEGVAKALDSLKEDASQQIPLGLTPQKMQVEHTP